jgi:hypothetical protein
MGALVPAVLVAAADAGARDRDRGERQQAT